MIVGAPPYSQNIVYPWFGIIFNTSIPNNVEMQDTEGDNQWLVQEFFDFAWRTLENSNVQCQEMENVSFVVWLGRPNDKIAHRVGHSCFQLMIISMGMMSSCLNSHIHCVILGIVNHGQAWPT